MAPRISICIPTHDGRAALLGEALESVLAQDDARIEVCVSDNASQDATREVVAAARERIGDRLVYHRNETNLGFTGNLLAVMDAASGGYCWMLGSDDRLAPGAVAAALALVGRHPGATGFTVARRHFDPFPPFEDRPDAPASLPPGHEREQVFRSAEEALLACGHLQGYISTQIVSREAWGRARAGATAADLGRSRNYPHLHLIGRMLLDAPHWVWHPGELVMHRATADPLIGQRGAGHAPFQVTDLTERKAIWGHLYGERSRAFRGLMYAAWRDHARLKLVAIYKSTPDHRLADDLILLRGFPRLFAWLPRFWLETAPALAIPHPVFKLAWRAYARFKKVPA